MAQLVTNLAEFQAIIEGNERVFVDFYADWCGPCKRIAPRIEALAHQFKKVKVIKVDVDQAQELSEKYGIKAMPTFMLFKNGAKVKEIVGANEKEVVEGFEKLAA